MSESVVPEKLNGPVIVVAVTTPPFCVESSALFIPESMRLVVEARVAVMLVVEAYGAVSLAVVGTLTLPAESMVVEAVEPKAAVEPVTRPEKRLVVVALVAINPPLKVMRVEVAFDGNGYANVVADVR